MTYGFADHEYDKMKLNSHNKELCDCDSYVVEKNGKATRVIVVKVLTCECVWRRCCINSVSAGTLALLNSDKMA